MKFIEMTGKQLTDVINDGELHVTDLAGAGVDEDSIVRVNEHGDIEVRRPAKCAGPAGGEGATLLEPKMNQK